MQQSDTRRVRSLRLSASVDERLVVAACDAGISANAWIERALAAALSGDTNGDTSAVRGEPPSDTSRAGSDTTSPASDTSSAAGEPLSDTSEPPSDTKRARGDTKRRPRDTTQPAGDTTPARLVVLRKPQPEKTTCIHNRPLAGACISCRRPKPE